MKTPIFKCNALKVACGVILIGAAMSVSAQQPRSTTPDTVQPPASAQPSRQPTPSSNRFTSMDKNLDTRISVEEYRGATLAAFQSMDKNRDGKIGGVELSEVEPAPSDKSPLSSAKIGELDVNKDSQLTSTELLNGASRLFKNLDIDGNSFLSAEELSGRQYRSKGEPDVDSGKSETRVQPDK